MIFLCLALLVAPALGHPFIIGGENAKPGEFPWQGSLQDVLNRHICGCAVISDTWIATAAHCVGNPTGLTVVVGMHSQSDSNQGKPVRHTIGVITAHPDFEQDGTKGFPNDVALIKLANAIDMRNAFVEVVDMAPQGAVLDGENCIISGWGLIKGGALPDILQKGAVEVFTKAYCTSKWGAALVHDFHICVGDVGAVGACSGDSGGPLTCPHGGKTVLAGVTSWGNAFCSTQMPSVYTRISYFRDWIKEVSGL